MSATAVRSGTLAAASPSAARGRWFSGSVLIFPIVCLAYFSSEAILRRFCYDVTAVEITEEDKQALLNQVPSFFRRPLEEHLAREAARKDVARAVEPAARCEALRKLISTVKPDQALPLHREIVELCPDSPATAPSLVEVLRQDDNQEEAVHAYLEFLARVGSSSRRDEYMTMWMAGTPLAAGNEEALLDYLADAAMSRLVSADLTDRYRELERMAAKRGHDDMEQLAKRLQGMCEKKQAEKMKAAEKAKAAKK